MRHYSSKAKQERAAKNYSAMKRGVAGSIRGKRKRGWGVQETTREAYHEYIVPHSNNLLCEYPATAWIVVSYQLSRLGKEIG